MSLHSLAGEQQEGRSCRSLLPLCFTGSVPQLRSSLPQGWLFGPVPAFVTPAGWSFRGKKNPQKQQKKRKPAHTSVSPGLPSVRLACWCHRVAPCSTCVLTLLAFQLRSLRLFFLIQVYCFLILTKIHVPSVFQCAVRW